MLILDGLSLRELPWLLQGAKERGFTLARGQRQRVRTARRDRRVRPRARLRQPQPAAEQRRRARAQAATGAAPNASDLPWKDCESLVGSSPNWVFWHHWPDAKLHDGSGAGQGLDTLTQDAAEQLTSDDFLGLRRASGHRAAARHHLRPWLRGHGLLPRCAMARSASSSRQTFSSGRSISGSLATPARSCRPWHLQINSPHGAHLLALGRRKWKSQGGYPTLTHGGLSLLEVLSPFVELTK